MSEGRRLEDRVIPGGRRGRPYMISKGEIREGFFGSVWISPGEGEKILRLWGEGDGKEGIFKVYDRKMCCVRWNRGEEGVGVRN